MYRIQYSSKVAAELAMNDKSHNKVIEGRHDPEYTRNNRSIEDRRVLRPENLRPSVPYFFKAHT